MAKGRTASSRFSVCVSLVTRSSATGIGTILNPFFDAQLWDTWQTYAREPRHAQPCARITDAPFEHAVALTGDPGTQIVGRVVAEVLVDGVARDPGLDLQCFDRPSTETWPALRRASLNDSRLSPVEQARRWRDIPAWRRAAKRPRALPAAFCRQIHERVRGTVGAGGSAASIWSSVV